MIIARTVIVSDPFARANVLEAFAGRGAPAGVVACSNDGSSVTISFDPERTSPGLIDALVDVESTFVPARAGAIEAAGAAAIAARGLDEPNLDVSRMIETYLT